MLPCFLWEQGYKMTKFKCKISDLETIVRLTESKGKNIDGKEYQALMDCLIVASDNTLSVKGMDIQHTFAMQLTYKNIDTIEAGELPIGDLSNFSAILGRFNPLDEIVVYTQENKIFIERESPKKIAKIPLVAQEAIASIPVPPIDNLKRTTDGYPTTGKTNLNTKIVINAEQITSIFEDGNVIKERIIPWKLEEGKLKVSIGSETFGSFETELIPESIEYSNISPVQSKTQTAFGNGLDNIFSNLSGKLKIYLADAVDITPLCVEQETEKFTYLALLAPYAMRD